MVVSFCLIEVVAIQDVPEERVQSIFSKESFGYIHVHYIDKLDSTP